MSKLPPSRLREAPKAFAEHNQRKYERTVQLTRQAIDKLEKEGEAVTLATLCEATRPLDDQGRGLRPITVLRNPQAAELFHQHSAAYQARQQKAKKVKRKHPKITDDTRTMYRGFRSSALIQAVENLKTQVAAMTVQQDKLKNERDQACQLRDEALQQNTRQLAALTKLKSKKGT